MSFTNDDYTIAWLSALPDELAAARAFLDDIHDDLPSIASDQNAYVLGSMGKHNIVIAPLPDGTPGNVSAATVATSLLHSFPNIRFGIMVGVGGGAPCSGKIRLGDVVVSRAEGQYGGVIKYDFGTNIQDVGFQIKGSLNKSPQILTSAVSKLRGRSESEGYRFGKILDDMFLTWPRMKTRFQRPGNDLLFEQHYIHKTNEEDCANCAHEHLVQRAERPEEERIQVHYGLIGSADQVVRDAKLRDRLQRDFGIKCFEMEAAGLMDNFPCIVVRGICDYADTHKNKHWQPYASAIAGAFTKELLSMIPSQQVKFVPQAQNILEEVEKHTEILGSMDQKLEENLQGKDNECLRNLRQTDPSDDKDRIEVMKGGLLYDSYVWIKNHDSFQNWRNNPDCKLLWISGDAGKGKTMLLCGIINELNNMSTSYFFFQNHDSRLNTGTSAIRGLMFMMIKQHPVLVKHVREVYDQAGNALFEDANSWYSLSKIFLKMLADPLLEGINIIIDAFDECVKDRDELIQLVVSYAQNTTTKWIISSRPWPEIKKHLSPLADENRLSLELNTASIKAAVTLYIDYKVNILAKQQRYAEKIKTGVLEHLHKKAQDTFLWVALVVQYLAKVKPWRIEEALEALPPGMDELYQRMLSILLGSPETEILQRILAVNAITFRPLTIPELKVYLDDFTRKYAISLESIGELVEDCGSFLTMQGASIQFVHASARDYILTGHRRELFTTEIADLHHSLFCTSIKAMSAVLHQDMYNLKLPGTDIEDISPPDPNPLQAIHYSCTHFLNHLAHAGELRNIEIRDNSILHEFVLSNYVYWLEAMSLLRNAAQANVQITDLNTLLQYNKTLFQSNEFKDLIYDAHRFVATFAPAIENHPLQIYCSGLLFAPQASIIKETFWDSCRPVWIDLINGPAEKDWAHMLRSFRGHKAYIRCETFSPNGDIIATGSTDRLIELWSPFSGTLLATLKGHRHYIKELEFAPNGSVIASMDDEATIMIWDVKNASLLKAIYCDLPYTFCRAYQMTFFPSSDRLATCRTGKVEAFDTFTGVCLSSWSVQEEMTVSSLHVSHDGLLIASISGQSIEGVQLQHAELYHAESGAFVQELARVSIEKRSVVRQDHVKVKFSKDDRYIVWQLDKMPCWFDFKTAQTLKPALDRHFDEDIVHVSFELLPNSSSICIHDTHHASLEIFDLSTGTILKRIASVSEIGDHFTFSPHCDYLLCGSKEATTFLLDLRHTSTTDPSLHLYIPEWINFMPCGTKLFVRGRQSKCAYILDIYNQTRIEDVLSHGLQACMDVVAFHPSGRMALSIQNGLSYGLWYHFGQMKLERLLMSRPVKFRFSPSGEKLLVGFDDGSLIMFDASTVCHVLWQSQAHRNTIFDIVFLKDECSFVSIDIQDPVAKFWTLDQKTPSKEVNLPYEASALAVSPNGFEIAISFQNHYFVAVYELPSFRQKLSFNAYSWKLSYDDSGEFLKSKTGIWKVDRSQPAAVQALHDARSHVFERDSWIYQDGQKLLWIPPAYGQAYTFQGNTVVLGHIRSTKLMIIQINWSHQQGVFSNRVWWEESDVWSDTESQHSAESSVSSDDEDDKNDESDEDNNEMNANIS